MEDKNKTSIEELIENTIPNNYGLVLDNSLLFQLWEDEQKYNELKNYLTKKIGKNLSQYLRGELHTFLLLNLELKDEQKVIKLNEESILNMIMFYFNSKFDDDTLYPVVQFFSEEEKEKILDIMLEKLKELIRLKRKKLENSKNLEDIKKISSTMYEFYKYIATVDPKSRYLTKEEAIKDDIKIQTEQLKTLNLWLKKELNKICEPLQIELFKGININKLKLYIAKQYLENIEILNNTKATILLDTIKRTIFELKNDDVSLVNVYFMYGNQINMKLLEKNKITTENSVYYDYYDNKMLEKEFNEYLEQNTELKVKLDKLSEYKKEDFSNLNYNEIIEYVDMILEDEEIKKELEEIDEKDITNELSTLAQEIDEENISEENRNKLISQKYKLEFLFKECKPYKICKGINTFDGYYGYIYPNGILVLDYINKDPKKSYGNAIYIMPLEKLKDYSNLSKQEIRNKISKNELEDVKYIYHDPKGNWKEKIKSKISNLTSKELDINYDEIELPFDLKELDKIEEKLSQTNNSIIKNKIEKQKEEIIKKSKEIDEKIKIKKSTTEINNIEREELKQEEQELSNSDYQNFIELFDKWLKNNKKETVKRNSAVSLYTKLRSRDDEGNFRCELCNCAGFSATDFESHHFIPISKNGPDNIYNTVCLCPNCHTNIHNNKITYNQKYNLLMKIKQNIETYNPEYIEQFNYYFDEIINIYKRTLDSLTNIEEEKKYYKKHKEQIEELFKIYYIGSKNEQKKK